MADPQAPGALARQMVSRFMGTRPSQSTTAAGVMNDLLDQTLAGRQATGTAPVSEGITKIRPRAESPNDAQAQVQSWGEALVQRKRGMAFDNDPTNPKGYREKRFAFLRESEGERTWAYKDHKGITTVGIGFNMERPDAKQVFKNALNLDESQFEAVRSGRRPLAPGQARRLFDYNAQEAESIVASKFPDQTLSEGERISLVSLAFNGGPNLIGPNLTRLVKSGDKVGAADEIMWRSNRTRHKGLANRRYREALMFAGESNVDLGTGENKEATMVFPPFKEYMTALSAKRHIPVAAPVEETQVASVDAPDRKSPFEPRFGPNKLNLAATGP